MKSFRSVLTVMCACALEFAVLLPAGAGLSQAASGEQASTVVGMEEAQKTRSQRRQESLERQQEALQIGQAAIPDAGLAPLPQPAVGYNPLVDYTKPNFANSPILRKFVDTLPGLGYANRNNRGQYIPVAQPDTSTYPGSDYYEITLREYRQQLHSDLPATGTRLRGYAQTNATDPHVQNINQYLGPLIIARSYDPNKPAGDPATGNGKPVRLKFINSLPIGAGGKLFLPVDTTVMGAGTGPKLGTELYTQNRSDIHLHGGFTPWISDGTPHQWITPAGETTSYPKGVSFQNVPDMVGPGKSIPAPSPTDGMGTYFYPNQQSARLMFYHDHAYGITRLNVYGGMAAGYLLTDQVEEDLISGTNLSGGNPNSAKVLPDLGGVYHYGIPLIIQDRTFVNDSGTAPPAGFTGTPTPVTAAVDPLWKWGAGGNLWFPHEYMPNEDIYDPSGMNPMGRWDYGPWVAPPLMVANLTLPSPTIIPEAYGDTPLVNGCAYPTVTLPPAPVRFRILNACNDRMLNLQLYYADPAQPTEVRMVPAVPNPAHPTWPRDGRDGGVPDPTTVGPAIIQIGNEGGFLPAPAVIPPQPVDFDYNRRSVTFGNVSSKALYMAPAERADIIVDLSLVPPGSKLILYNDAPAPAPLYDSRNDYYTGDPDQSAIGGAPATIAGFGPNMRTVMQIVIDPGATPPATPFDLAALQNALPPAYQVSQEPPIVPESAYNAAFGATWGNTYARTVDQSLNLTGSAQSIAKVVTTAPGSGYMTPPTVVFDGGGGTGAAATASLNGITAVTVTATGSGYTTRPTVVFTPAVGGGGTGAKALATISGGVVIGITVSNPGSGYRLAPTVTLTGGGGTGATAVASVVPGSVGAITLTNPGSGYTSPPLIFLVGGGGFGAQAACLVKGGTVMGNTAITEGFDVWYGRMNAELGTIPTLLDPTAPTPAVPGAAAYIDPPSDILDPGQTYLWRISHIGADSHIVHFHLMNVQVVNRVDWTNSILPPDGNELGWKESVRTNPRTDLIVAFRPKLMWLPFQIPTSNRLLDPTTPKGSTMNFTPVPLLPGQVAPAGMSNVMTDYGWEYVWHCHLLGHEENDMMRPLVLNVVPPAAPANLTATVSVPAPGAANVALTWTSADPSVSGFTIQRSGTATFTTGLRTYSVQGGTVTSFNDVNVIPGARYYYRILAFSAVGNSAWTPAVMVITVVPPASFKAVAIRTGTTDRVTLSWTASAPIAGFTIQRATNAAFTAGLQTYAVAAAARSYVQNALPRAVRYFYRIRTDIAIGSSAWSPNAVVTTP